jgi:hypothetical protein
MWEVAAFGLFGGSFITCGLLFLHFVRSLKKSNIPNQERQNRCLQFPARTSR